MYDNSASILGIIMCDLFNSLVYNATSYPTVGVNVFGLIGTTESDKYGTETQKFDLAFQQISNIQASLANELTNDIFMTKDENIGSN
jgi:hypothetical protein